MKQLQLKLGRLFAEYGLYEARMRANPGVSNPSMVVRYRLLAHPSNLQFLQDLAAESDYGAAWATDSQAGLSIATVPAVMKFAGAMAGRTDLRRVALIEAWAEAVSLLPGAVRPRLVGRNKPYHPAEWLTQREEAVEKVQKLQSTNPPRHARLPKDFEQNLDKDLLV